MERTRRTKANLHPAAPVLEAKQKQRTSVQKAADDALIKEQVDEAAWKKAKEHAPIVKKIAELQDALWVEDMTSLTEAAGPTEDQGLPSPLSHLVEAADPELAEPNRSRYGHTYPFGHERHLIWLVGTIVHSDLNCRWIILFSLSLNPWTTMEMSIKLNQSQMNLMTTI